MERPAGWECSRGLIGLVKTVPPYHLLLSEGQTWRFAHPLIRHVFYQTPSAARRQRLHQQIGQMLEHLYADSFDAHLREIAHHCIRAGPAAAPRPL